MKLELRELKTPPAAVQALLLCGCWTVVLGRRPIQSLWTHTHTSDLKVSPEQLPLSGFSFFLFKSLQIILKKKKKPKQRQGNYPQEVTAIQPTHTYRHNITLSSKAAKYVLNVKHE